MGSAGDGSEGVRDGREGGSHRAGPVIDPVPHPLGHALLDLPAKSLQQLRTIPEVAIGSSGSHARATRRLTQ